MLHLLFLCRRHQCFTRIHNSKKQTPPIIIISSSHVCSLSLILLILLLCYSIPKVVVEALILSAARTRSSRSVRAVPHLLFQKYNVFMSSAKTSNENFPEEDFNLHDSQQGSSSLLTVGRKIQQTAEPCVILMKQIISEYVPLWIDRGGIYSLAQVSVFHNCKVFCFQ
jgi:hypothetical protein